ncbi:MAG: LysM peptidoglycan-binding domain-containing protein [Ferrimonas sp.]
MPSPHSETDYEFATSELLTLPEATPETEKEPEPAQPVTDVWQRIAQQMQLPVVDNQRIDHFRQWYIKNPNHLKVVSQRAVPFMHLIVEEIERRQLPMELALLPIVESAFDVFAYSGSSASGLWQFTAPMARHFGLTQNWWYDGRRDVHAATVAAMDMMEYLHNKLGEDWHYALAAYNTGEGRVFRAIRNNRAQGLPTDYFSLDLPTETERYVPQLLALVDVIKNAEAYGIELTPINNTPYLQRVDIGSQLDLAKAAAMAGLTTAELHRLNPGFNRWATAPEGPHHLLLPVEQVEGFVTALAQIDPQERLTWHRYVVQRGDSLSVIAAQHQTSIATLQSTNKLNGYLIRAGQTLLIPTVAANGDSAQYNPEQRAAPQRNQKQQKREYTIKSGDSLWRIARANGTTVKQLATWNNMRPSQTLSVGKKLVIWREATNSRSPTTVPKVQYTVRSGDSLGRIGQRFNVSVADLIRWNNLSVGQYLQPGQKLTVAVNPS